MLLSTLFAFQLAATLPQPAERRIYNGRAGETSVAIPKIAATIDVDGRLDEPVWSRAAVLTGFSVYQPIDHQPAPDSTEVFVWYSTDAIHFGIRAFEPHGPVTTSLSDRDHITADDNIEIHLDPFAERNRALVFIVNPLGVQADGTKGEGGGFIPGSNVSPGQNDLSADFIWQSKGRVIPGGYEVEIRIPFSSMRYPVAEVQDWGVQIDRHVQHSGYEQTFTPAVRANASFIAQEGWLRGMTGMHHGQVIEANPEATNTVSGGPAATAGDWRYTSRPQLGGNLRWTLGSDFVLNGTIKPDFSQVEADAAQIAADQRFALFYPEKRPFFVEGSDQFNVPNTLVYTRRIVQPAEALKLTGKLDRTDVAVLSALDDRSTSAVGDRPLVDAVRLRQAIFDGQSNAGLLYSDRVTSARANRLLGGDTHIVFGRLYYFQAQIVGSATRDTTGAPTRGASMWELATDRTGRSFGFHYNILGIDSAFHADNGFVQRTGVVIPGIHNRFTLYGKPGGGGVFERYNAFIHLTGVWRYRDFFAGRSLLEDQLSVQNTVTLRGGWQITMNPALSSYAFDPAAYRNLYVATPVLPCTVACSLIYAPMTLPDRTPTLVSSFGVTTPQYRRYDAAVNVVAGNDIDFVEAAEVRRRDVSATVNLRPTDRVRINATYVSSSYTRRRSDVESFSTRIPRLKVEYQVARPLFIRVVSQYQSSSRAVPETSDGQTLYTKSGTTYAAASSESNGLRADWLFSYRPNPGTVVFFGYGNTLTEPDPLALTDLRRTSDAFFVKLSYLFRTVQ